MRKIKILGAFIAALAFSACAVASASASLWLVGSITPTKALSAPLHGKFILVHEGGSLGKAKLECSELLIGSVELNESKTTLVENLTGTEKDLIGGCFDLEGFCPGAVVHPVGLPWLANLIVQVNGTWVEYLTSGYNVLCSFGIQVTCEGKVKTLFEGNGTNGAKFSFKGKESGEQACSDGGKGTLTSNGASETLGAGVS